MNCISTNGPESHVGGARGGPGKAPFGNRRVDHARGPEAFDESARHLEGTAVDPDVLTHEKHAFVAFHLFPERLRNRLQKRGRLPRTRSGDVYRSIS